MTPIFRGFRKKQQQKKKTIPFSEYFRKKDILFAKKNFPRNTPLAKESGLKNYPCERHTSITCVGLAAWWRHQMEIFSAVLAICAGNSPVPGEFPAQRPVTRSFDVLSDLCPNKRLSKQSWGWWFETLSRPLWRHRDETTFGLVPIPTHQQTCCSLCTGEYPCNWFPTIFVVSL